MGDPLFGWVLGVCNLVFVARDDRGERVRPERGLTARDEPGNVTGWSPRCEAAIRDDFGPCWVLRCGASWVAR